MRTMGKVYAIPISLVIIGGALTLWANTLPRYHDPHWMDRFVGVQATVDNSHALSNEWYAAREEAGTSRDLFFDLGMGVAVLGLSLASMFGVLRVRNIVDLHGLMTPRSPLTWYLTAAVAWLSFVPAVWAYLLYTYKRGDYPWWADSITIPAAGAVLYGFWGVLIVLLVVRLSVKRATLPVRLWTKPILGGAKIVGVGALLATLLFLILLANWVMFNFFTVPSVITMLYISLCCRAAAATTGRAA